MADEVKKTVITEFIAETEKYVAGLRKMESSLEDVAEGTKEVGTQSKKTSATMQTSFGGIADGVGKLVPGLRGVTDNIKKSEDAAKKFGISTKAALISTGIGAFVVLVGKLVSVWSEVGGVADEQLSFAEKKIKDVGNSIAEFFSEQSKRLADWAERHVGILFAFNTALGIMVTNWIAASKAHSDYVASVNAGNEATKIEIYNLERQIALASLVKDNQKELLRLENELLNAKMKMANEDEARGIEIAMAVNYAKQEAIRLNEIENAQLAAKFELYKNIAPYEALSIQQERLATDLQITANAEKQFAITQAQIAASVQLDNVDQQAAKSKIVAQGAIADVMAKSMLWQKAQAISEAVIAAKLAILAIWAQVGVRFPRKVVESAIVAGITIKQIKDIAGVTFTAPAFAEGGHVPKKGGMIRGNRHAQGGVRFGVGGYAAEAEGGEFIVNRRATSKFFPVLNAINNTGKFEQGGFVAPDVNSEQIRAAAMASADASKQQTVLVLEDFRRANNRLQIVEQLAGLNK